MIDIPAVPETRRHWNIKLSKNFMKTFRPYKVIRRLNKRFTQLASHPLTKKLKFSVFWRYIKFHIYHRSFSGPKVYPFVNQLRFYAQLGMAGIVGNIYTGLYDFPSMSILLHFAGENDLFVDVGANVGAYTLLAAGVCKSEVYAFEPAVDTFQLLKNNLRLNHLLDLVNCCNFGLGSRKTKLRFTKGADVCNRVVTDKMVLDEWTEIDVFPLDDIMQDKHPSIMKIDVEGFELEVLMGAEKILSNPTLCVIIVEMNNSGNVYGFDDDQVHKHLIKFGFIPFRYEPFTRTISRTLKTNSEGINKIYLRNLDLVSSRVQTAPSFSVLGIAI